jgi:hypothetical protein
MKFVMKKFALVIGTFGVIALLGAGCAPESAAPVSQPSAQNNQPVMNTPTVAVPIPYLSELKDFPAITTLATPIDENAWATTMTKTGVALRVPDKGATAPTSWTYAVIDNNDPHLKGDCYVTEDIVFKETSMDEVNLGNACQTATEFKDGPSTRTDYFVFHTGWTDSKGVPVTRTNLITFTKKYPAGFDMNAYSATVRHIIRIID